jgi:hypothetical protein
VAELVGRVALNRAEDASEAGRSDRQQEHDDDRNDEQEAAHLPVIGRPAPVP